MLRGAKQCVAKAQHDRAKRSKSSAWRGSAQQRQGEAKHRIAKALCCKAMQSKSGSTRRHAKAKQRSDTPGTAKVLHSPAP
jgi:hypothetical protein